MDSGCRGGPFGPFGKLRNFIGLKIVHEVSLANPVIAFINVFCNIRAAFAWLYIPSMVLAVIAYSLLGWRYGLEGVAAGNIVAYGAFVVLGYAFLLRWKRTRDAG